MLRLCNIPPSELTADQRPSYDRLHGGIGQHLAGFTTHKPDGTLIGPFNEMLHFPTFGGPGFDLFLALAAGSVMPREAREVAVLATGARLGAVYEIYSHETLAAKTSLSPAKIRTIAAGERPADLTEPEAIAYDVVAVLHRGHQVPDTLHKATVAAFGEQGAAETAFLVGCCTMICGLLNVFDVDLTETEEGGTTICQSHDIEERR